MRIKSILRLGIVITFSAMLSACYGTSNYSGSSKNSSLSSDSRITSTGKIRNANGSLSRISSSGRRILHEDGSMSRITRRGKIRNEDGTICRTSASGRRLICY